MVFSSPRNGNFDLYVATLDAAGKEAMKKLSSETELSPALANAGHPAGLSTQGPTPVPNQAAASQPVASQPVASQPVAAAPSVPQNEPGILPSGISPYVLALGGLAVVWVLVEGVMIARRRRRRRGSGTDGQ
jgi:hypothetical protein